MKKLRNSLYITSQNSYLHKQGETISLRRGEEKPLLIPVHTVQAIFCFGLVMVSPQLMAFCAEQGVCLSFFTEYGRFLGKFEGKTQGSILLRRAQFSCPSAKALDFSRWVIAAKIRNSRQVLLRRLRTYGECAEVQEAVRGMAGSLHETRMATSLEQLRGIEGEAAARYFSVFSELIQPARRADFPFSGRNRRPPRDAVNALLSFVYAIAGRDISAALQGVGLDPQAGFLHTDRSGRDSLALDMLEEFRAWFADRLVLSLINRQQLQRADFIFEVSGAVRLTDDGRKTVLTAIQQRKQEEIVHPLLGENVQVGIVPHVQAMLLARYIRGEQEAYPPFISR